MLLYFVDSRDIKAKLEEQKQMKYTYTEEIVSYKDQPSTTRRYFVVYNEEGRIENILYFCLENKPEVEDKLKSMYKGVEKLDMTKTTDNSTIYLTTIQAECGNNYILLYNDSGHLFDVLFHTLREKKHKISSLRDKYGDRLKEIDKVPISLILEPGDLMEGLPKSDFSTATARAYESAVQRINKTDGYFNPPTNVKGPLRFIVYLKKGTMRSEYAEGVLWLDGLGVSSSVTIRMTGTSGAIPYGSIQTFFKLHGLNNDNAEVVWRDEARKAEEAATMLRTVTKDMKDMYTKQVRLVSLLTGKQTDPLID